MMPRSSASLAATDTPQLPTLGIMGAGKLARTLARLWAEQAVFRIGSIGSRRPASATDARAFIGSGTVAATAADLHPADLWLLATPDDQLGSALQELLTRDLVHPGTVVFHCSGALSSTILQAAQTRGGTIASVHPAHSFADPQRSLATFSGSACACEGDSAALQQLLPAFRAIGGLPFAVNAEHKTLYHAGSVIACNYLVTLLETALDSFAAAGVERHQAAALLGPLVHQTVDNVLGGSRGAALTGPIARGDDQTVQRQARALQEANPRWGALYRLLGQHTAVLAAARDSGDAPALARMFAALSDNSPPPE